MQASGVCRGISQVKFAHVHVQTHVCAHACGMRSCFDAWAENDTGRKIKILDAC